MAFLKRRRVEIVIVLALLTVLVMQTHGHANASGAPVSHGSPAVHRQIAISSDCEQLQGIFDQAGDNWDAMHQQASLQFMNEADDRMRDVGCYD